MAITINFQHPVHLPFRRKIKRLVQEIFHQEGRTLSNLNIVFCSDAYLLNMNQIYLSHDYYTDIITFDISNSEDIHAEIYISVDTAAVNAIEYKVLLINELIRLIIHGCLHLCGFSDKKKSEKNTMTKAENRYLLYYESL